MRTEARGGAAPEARERRAGDVGRTPRAPRLRFAEWGSGDAAPPRVEIRRGLESAGRACVELVFVAPPDPPR